MARRAVQEACHVSPRAVLRGCTDLILLPLVVAIPHQIKATQPRRPARGRGDGTAPTGCELRGTWRGEVGGGGRRGEKV